MGSPILGQRIWQAAYTELETVTSAPPVPRRRSPPPRRVMPKVVVQGEMPAPRPSSSLEWTVCGKQRKVKIESLCVFTCSTCNIYVCVNIMFSFQRKDPASLEEDCPARKKEVRHSFHL